MLAPHTVVACCQNCSGDTCTACSEPKPGKTCRPKVETTAKCAAVDDVVDCAPASEVDPNGRVRSRLDPFDMPVEPKG